MSNIFNPFIGVTKIISAEISGKFAELQAKAEQISEELSALTITDTNISGQVNVLDKKINLLNAEKIDDYTAFEVFPHDFAFPVDRFSTDTQFGVDQGAFKIKQLFADWLPVKYYAIYEDALPQTGQIVTYVYRLVNDMTQMKRFVYDAEAQQYFTAYTMAYTDIATIAELPQVGQYNLIYRVADTGEQFMYNAYFKQYKKYLTTAQDDDIIFAGNGGVDKHTSAGVAFRVALTAEQIAQGKSDVIIDWGDGTQTLFKDYTSNVNSQYQFIHDYATVEGFKPQNYVIRVYGTMYFALKPYSTSIITNMYTPQLPIASFLHAYNEMFNCSLAFRLDLGYYGTRTFENCNLNSMFYGGMSEIKGFKRSFSDRFYSIGRLFSGFKRINVKTFDFKIPAEVTDGSFNNLFSNVLFFTPGTTTSYDILKVFAPNSFAQMKNYASVNVTGIFQNCQNITCSDYQKLGSYLWNNPDINWTGTTTAFAGCPEELCANIPEQWGGTLTGWSAPNTLKEDILINAENISINTENIQKLEAEKATDYTAFEVFPHNFGIHSLNSAMTVQEAFANWYIPELPNGYIPNYTSLETDASHVINRIFNYNYTDEDGINQSKLMRFHPNPEIGHIQLTEQEITELPQIGQLNKAYYILDENNVKTYYIYNDEYITNLRNCLTTAKDTDILYNDISRITMLTITLRSHIPNPVQESDIVIDFGDGQIKYISETDVEVNNTYYYIKHTYTDINKNYKVKIYGKKYYLIGFFKNTDLITNCLTNEYPLASHIKSLNSFIAVRQLVFRLDIPDYRYNFDSFNLTEAFGGRIIEIPKIKPMPTSVYSMNSLFASIIYANKINFVIPALIENANLNKIFYNITFITETDILSFFAPYSLSNMKNASINVAGMFQNCQNIICSDYQKLGSYLWNNPDINWTETTTAFAGCPDELRANIPEQWGGTLTGWTAPERLTKEYVDNKIKQLQQQIQLLMQNAVGYSIEKS